MRGAILALVLVISLFVFGCLGGQGNANVSANASGQAGGGAQGGAQGNAQGGAQGGVNGSGGTPPAPPSGGGASGGAGVNVSAGGGGSGSGGSDFAGKDFGGLLAMGVPVQCDVTTTTNGTTSVIHVFMNGNGVTRMEIATPDSSTCTATAILMTKDKMDMTCTQGTQMMKGCDWIEIPLNQTAGAGAGAGGSSSGTSEASGVQSASSTSFNCQPWVPDSSKFVTSGKVCNLGDLMNQYNAGGSANYSYG